MIPGVQPYLVTGGKGLAHQVPKIAADGLARPGGASQQNVPPVQARCVGAQHLPEKLRADQAPQVAPHVVRANAEEKRRLDLCFVEHVQQPGHPITGTPVGVDIDSKTCLHQRWSAISSMASRRKKSSVLPMVSLISTVGVQSSRRLAFWMLGLR
ncbi:hypothetical protein D3C78_1465890 [compost metagenome]